MRGGETTKFTVPSLVYVLRKFRRNGNFSKVEKSKMFGIWKDLKFCAATVKKLMVFDYNESISQGGSVF